MNNLFRKKGAVILLLVMILGLGLRIYDLAEEDLWLDEYASLKYSSLTKADPGNVPLYYVTLHYWKNIFGSSTFALRLLSVIFDSMSIILLYILGKKLFKEKIALFACFLLSTSVFHLVYSQEVRVYGTLGFFAIVSYLLLVKIIETHKLKYYMLYITIITIIHYFHTTGVVLLLFNFVMFFILNKKRQNIKIWIVSQIVIFILILPIISPFKRGVFAAIYRIINLVAPYEKIVAVGSLLIFLIVFLVILVNKSKIVDMVKLFYNKHFTQFYWVFIILFYTLYILLLGLIMTPFRMPFLRYSLIFSPILYLFISHGLFKIKKFRAVIIIFVVIVNSYSILSYYAITTKEPWSDAALFIETNEKNNDIILVDASYMLGPFNYYYKGALPRIGLLTRSMKELDIKRNTKLYLNNFTKSMSNMSDKDIWLVLSHNLETEDYYKLLLDKYYVFILEKHYKDIDLYYYKPKEDKINISEFSLDVD
ncbi:MAG: glycosyltransferase family 39 protein [Nanoarchaeota archaeon]